MPCANNNILITFKDGTIKKVNILSLDMIDETLKYLLEIRPDYFYKVNLDINGNGIYWEDYMYIHCMDLYNNGEIINLSSNDFKKIFEHTIINTKEACDLLSCSRQYIDKLVKTGKIKPIKEIDKTRLFLKSDVVKI